MADNTVALGVQVPDSFKTMGSMLNVANAMQEYKRGGVALQKEQATLQPQIKQQEEAAKQATIKTNLEQFKFTGEQAQAARNMSTALQATPDFNVSPQDTPDVVKAKQKAMVSKLIEAKQRAIGSGVDPAVAEVQFSHPIQLAGQDPHAVRQLLINAARGGQNAEAQAGVINAPLTAVSTGGTVTPTQLQPAAAPAPNVAAPGTPMPVTLGPGERQTVSTNPVTQSPQTVSKDPQGNVIGVTPTPTGVGVPQLAPGEPQEIPARTAQRVSVNQAASQVPEQHFNNRQIIELAPKAFTGGGSKELGQIFSNAGLQLLPGDDATNYQKLGHFMSRQVQANANAMGAGTDAAREIAANAAGTTNWTKDAIISTAKINDAFASGLEHFNAGMEKAIKNNGGNVLAIRDFQNLWSANFDPRVMQIANAVKHGDKQDLQDILKQVGGKNSPQAKDLIQKARNIESLTETGKL